MQYDQARELQARRTKNTTTEDISHVRKHLAKCQPLDKRSFNTPHSSQNPIYYVQCHKTKGDNANTNVYNSSPSLGP